MSKKQVFGILHMLLSPSMRAGNGMCQRADGSVVRSRQLPMRRNGKS